ncbi:Oidioi.mRNA.OKI2018_I69.chr2.g4874.t1.cds [Oikopleura dioica]|uniref:Oidioi.mRNA.OKI2018_I69.chr2.g4874.t1.cds n=1 Tax=Oikopleura dioica TaxID=34765 RepID=A0ABN7SZ41_OIKDI|nr:Oidioi.mRNA.OKI2018_I69.chr2.g4874.t1.cds [Oikopleura dioica]
MEVDGGDRRQGSSLSGDEVTHGQVCIPMMVTIKTQSERNNLFTHSVNHELSTSTIPMMVTMTAENAMKHILDIDDIISLRGIPSGNEDDLCNAQSFIQTKKTNAHCPSNSRRFIAQGNASKSLLEKMPGGEDGICYVPDNDLTVTDVKRKQNFGKSDVFTDPSSYTIMDERGFHSCPGIAWTEDETRTVVERELRERSKRLEFSLQFGEEYAREASPRYGTVAGDVPSKYSVSEHGSSGTPILIMITGGRNLGEGVKYILRIFGKFFIAVV